MSTHHLRHVLGPVLRPTVAAMLTLTIGLAGAVPTTAVAAEGPRVIEETVVTARKREENIQDVGLSVSALSQEEIENNYARDLRDLVFVSPSLVLDDTAQGPGGVASAYIRGIGVSEVEKNFDPAVGVVVDGIFLGTMTGGITHAIDLESVEVLRGPQGTLFGRNTIGGVINLRRSQPTGELGGKVRASYGNFETKRLDGLLNFGLGDMVAVKLTGTYEDQSKGYYKNVHTGRWDGQTEYQSFGANVLYTPIDSLELEYTGQIERTDQDTPVLLNVGQPGQLFCDAFGFCSPDIHTPTSGDRLKTSQFGVGPNDATFDADTHMFEARWNINDSLSLDYVFGSWKTEETVLTDFDAVKPVLFHTSRPAEYEQTSHELRLTWDGDGPVRGTAGLYAWDSEYEIRLRSFIGFVVPDVVLDLPQTSSQSTESWAVFAEGDYDITDTLTLTLGGRYTEDKKDTKQQGIVNASADDDWNQFTPKVGLKYQLNDDAMVYLTYSVGYRSGGFNGRVDSVENATTPYDQEKVANYEGGFKTDWMDGTLRVNGALFYMDYQDKQEELQLPSRTSGTGQVTLVANAATAILKGVELDVTWLPTDALSLRANLGLLDASYDKFEFRNAAGLQDLSGLELRRAPEVSGTLSATYEWTIADNRTWAVVGWHHMSAYEVDFANKPELTNDPQDLVDASLNYQIGQLQISAFGHNLLDEDGYTIGFDVASLWSYAATRPPRTFGIEVNYVFGQ